MFTKNGNTSKASCIGKGNPVIPNQQMGKDLPVEIREMIVSFYKEDDISRPMPGKKDCFTIKKNGVKIKVQKRLVLSNLKETYRQFKDRYLEIKIGFSKFASLRPRECVLAGATHSVCVCMIHSNVKLMMTGSMMNKRTANEEIPLKHYSHAIAKTMCNPSLPSCHLGDCTECPGKKPLREMLERCFNEEEIEEIELKQWATTDPSTLQTIVQPTNKSIEHLPDKLETLRRHDFIAKQQSRHLTERKETLKEGEFLVTGNFSDNFSFVVRDEAQSSHWDNGMVTLHPFVYYYKDEGQNLSWKPCSNLRL